MSYARRHSTNVCPGNRVRYKLTEGMTILTASTKDQYASENNGSGVFTTLFVDALDGAAGNLVGDVTPGSVYAHIDQSLGSWAQRPVFKTNVKSFVSLREVQPPIPLAHLQQLTEFFPEPGFQFQLDPSFEPEVVGRPAGACPPDPINTAKFKTLQKYNRVNLLKPVDAPHMWHAAIGSKTCQLTVLGEHYRRLKRFSDSPCTAWARRGTSAYTNAGGPMQAYSMDLRERALLDSDAGMKAADVAVKYRVSGSWVRLLKQRRRETGEVAPRVQRHGRRRMLEPHLHTLAALIAEQPDRTLAELKDALGTPASLATIWRAVAALDVTIKKNGPALRTRST